MQVRDGTTDACERLVAGVKKLSAICGSRSEPAVLQLLLQTCQRSVSTFLADCVLVFLGYCYLMLSVPVQLTAWKDGPRNSLLCPRGSLSNSLTRMELVLV